MLKNDRELTEKWIMTLTKKMVVEEGIQNDEVSDTRQQWTTDVIWRQENRDIVAKMDLEVDVRSLEKEGQ